MEAKFQEVITIPKRQPVGEDYKNSVDHSEREQPGKFYGVACDDQLSDAREQRRQRQSVNEREKRGDMFKGCHVIKNSAASARKGSCRSSLDAIRRRACRKTKNQMFCTNIPLTPQPIPKPRANSMTNFAAGRREARAFLFHEDNGSRAEVMRRNKASRRERR